MPFFTLLRVSTASFQLAYNELFANVNYIYR